MKKIFCITLLALGFNFTLQAQLQTPKASPLAKVEQKVGLTDIKIEYSRPSKNDRVVFGEVVPFDEIWRTGANENTKFTCSDPLIFGKDTLKAGTYAIYTKPSKTSWDIMFYTDINNWGTPEKWEQTKVALTAKASVNTLANSHETFSISIENIEISSAEITFTWDKTMVKIPFQVPTNEKVMAAIEKTMAGPSAGDYYGAANYYFTEKKDLNQALIWINKAIEKQGEEAFWVIRTKALIQAELGDKKGAIETAKISLKAAEKAGNKRYVEMNNASISEWSK